MHIEFKSFFGADAINYLKLYLKTRGEVSDDAPLFTKLGTNKRATLGAIQNQVRIYAEKVPWISPKDLDGWNPARPHSLRAGFRSRLTGKVDRDLLEFWMGHAIGEVPRAYLNMPDEEMKELYENLEKELSIEITSREVKTGQMAESEEVSLLKRNMQNISSQVVQLEAQNSTLMRNVKELKDTVEAAKFFWGEGQEDSLNKITSLADEVRSLREAVHVLEGELSRAEDAKKLKN